VRSALALVIFLALAFAAAAIGGVSAAGGTEDWYESLRRPSWRPPNWVFGPVWTVLYVTIAVAGWLVWRERGSDGVTEALAIWAVQLALNAAWTGLFFGLHRPGLAFVEILVLAVAVAATIVLFARVSLAAALLLVPYLAWVCFAAALNGSIWNLNR
jgi:benzodiazapine receptor